MKKRDFLWLCFLAPLLLQVGSILAGETNALDAEEPMTNGKLERILKTLEPNVKGHDGRWEMVRDGVPVLLLTDESHNRMRVIAPAAEAKDVTQQILLRMIEANFSAALDARYALFQGVIWAAFIHPLDSLRERDFIAGIEQVVALVKTTGTTYSSSGLHFGGPSYGEETK